MWRPLGSCRTKLTTTQVQAQALYDSGCNPGDPIPYMGYICLSSRHTLVSILWRQGNMPLGSPLGLRLGKMFDAPGLSSSPPGMWPETRWDPWPIPYSSPSFSYSQPPKSTLQSSLFSDFAQPCGFKWPTMSELHAPAEQGRGHLAILDWIR